MSNCIEIKNKQDCSGCTACYSICPNQAISMQEDNEGFLYPTVDKTKCVNCGLCKNTCPWLSEIKKDETYLKEPIGYVAKAKDKEVQMNSTSGGVFSVLAEEIIKKHGCVVGSYLDENMNIYHMMIDNTQDINKLVGSKYVSSHLNDIFKDIKEKLEDGKIVFFCGVPCQVNGLLKYLRKAYSNLYTSELICHGVPSQKLFHKYIEYLEKKNNFKVLNYKFRSKKVADWGTFKAQVQYLKDGKVGYKAINADFDKYYKNFLKAKGYRESCYVCHYAKKERNADFTLGDFWGIEKLMPDFYDRKGVSEILVNTKKGKELFERIEMLEIRDMNYKDLIKNNGQLEHPSPRTDDRNSYYLRN